MNRQSKRGGGTTLSPTWSSGTTNERTPKKKEECNQIKKTNCIKSKTSKKDTHREGSKIHAKIKLVKSHYLKNRKVEDHSQKPPQKLRNDYTDTKRTQFSPQAIDTEDTRRIKIFNSLISILPGKDQKRIGRRRKRVGVGVVQE